jgi:hypothetical protein
MLVGGKGNVTVKSDAVRMALDYDERLMAFLPSDVPSWDDAYNNKWLVLGRGALIMSPPSARAVAERDAPKVIEQLWTHDFAAGPKGRFTPFLPYSWGIWNFSKNQAATKSLIVNLSQQAMVEKMVEASNGYELPSFANFADFMTWAEERPPKGTLYHYPNPCQHQLLSTARAPAPHKIGEQIYVQALQTQMAVRHFRGEAMEKAVDWIANELEGFTRD